MDTLDKLQAKLRTINQVALARLRPGDSLQMQHERALLQKLVKGGAQLESVPLQTIDGALRAYRIDKYLKGLRQIKMVCYGAIQAVGADSWRLIEHREYFEKLLDHVEHYKERRRTFRKLYRALLNAYFSFDAESPDVDPDGRRNWETLRTFLAGHLESFVIGEFTPEWLATLVAYPDLLGEYPERSVAHGNWSVLGDICTRLELDAGTWLVRRLVMSQVVAAGRMDDATFKDEIDSLLLLLHDYPLYSAAGLTLLLERYAECEQPEVHEALRDFAIGLWGNPWLPDTQHQWRCSEAARAMMTHWLRRRLLAEFFSLLSNDDKKNPRRLKFWDLYSEDLTGLYFALGREAYVQGSMDLYGFRSAAKGLIAKLAEEKHGVHTCIMQFNHHHVVEFNRENNVAYFYDTTEGTPSFYFSKGWVDVGAIRACDIAEGVDIARVSKPVRHQDSRELSWEGKFAHEMGMTDNSLRAFCRSYQCEYQDTRGKDGCQWIRPSDAARYGSQVWSVLAGWGFHFSPEDGAYFHLTR